MCSKGAAGPGEVTEEIDFVPYILSCSSQPPLPNGVARRSAMWERAWVHLPIRQCSGVEDSSVVCSVKLRKQRSACENGANLICESNQIMFVERKCWNVFSPIWKTFFSIKHVSDFQELLGPVSATKVSLRFFFFCLINRSWIRFAAVSAGTPWLDCPQSPPPAHLPGPLGFPRPAEWRSLWSPPGEICLEDPRKHSGGPWPCP